MSFDIGDIVQWQEYSDSRMTSNGQRGFSALPYPPIILNSLVVKKSGMVSDIKDHTVQRTGATFKVYTVLNFEDRTEDTLYEECLFAFTNDEAQDET
jgi:hypothetical protein